MSEIETHTETDMPVTTTTIITIIFKNLLWLTVLAFYPVIDYLILITPTWKEFLENFQLIGGTIVVLLVIVKLLLEIVKLILKKDK